MARKEKAALMAAIHFRVTGCQRRYGRLWTNVSRLSHNITAEKSGLSLNFSLEIPVLQVGFH